MGAFTQPAAALAAVSPGVQAQGLWAGRRQLFVRFAGEAETATLFTAERLARQMERAAGQSPLHSIAIGGADPMANVAFLAAAFEQWRPTLPVMLDCGNAPREEALDPLVPSLALVQVTLLLTEAPTVHERALALLARAAAAGVGHALALAPADGVSDAQILRFVEQARRASPGTKLVVHPSPGAERSPLDRRYAALLEQVAAHYPDARLLMRVPPPVGLR